MKRKQKRYKSEQEILDSIDAQKDRVAELKKEAHRQHWLILHCDEECKRTDTGCYDHDHLGNEQAAWRAIDRIERQKLPKLKEALSQFRTTPFNFCLQKQCGGDAGVVLQ